MNQSKISCYNPAKSMVYKGVYANLFDLFKNVSDKFRENLDKFISETKVTEAMKFKFASYNRFSKKYWLESAEQEHGWAQRKIIDEQLHSNSTAQLRDWN